MRVVPVTIGNNDHHSNNNGSGGEGSNMDEIQSSEYLAIEPATLNEDRNFEVLIIIDSYKYFFTYLLVTGEILLGEILTKLIQALVHQSGGFDFCVIH